ncbi:hypothetical protein [Streptomyces sp. NPDC057682]|uniref:hypothetical protein n=1 Tax=Streptomyces sp. NPDC057682 TaxID=3346210 RepID=UPI0036816AAE
MHRRAGDRGSAVGTPELQRVDSNSRQLCSADVVRAVTNGCIFNRCAPRAEQMHMHLAPGRRLLAARAAGGRPVWEPLPRIPLPGAA